MAPGVDDLSLPSKVLAAGTAACFADFVTFPFDTAKVRLQIQGEAKLSQGGANRVVVHQYNGLFGTIATIVRQEGVRSLFNGLSAGLQRQICFASVRLGLYDSTKTFYHQQINGDAKSGVPGVPVRIAAGLTTGGLAVLLAQPTDVVKVRFQAQLQGIPMADRYTSTVQAYRTIAHQEGIVGLWKGVISNAARNSIVNVSEIVCYDIIKEAILLRNWMTDNIPCHFTSAVVAGLCTTVIASPVDVVKTRYMNSRPEMYSGAVNCAVQMFRKEGASAFYKGFTPSFARLVSWNIVLWLSFEQIKKCVQNTRKPQINIAVKRL